MQGYRGVEPTTGQGRGLDFGHLQVFCAVDDLTLEVGELNGVGVDDAEGGGAPGREVEQTGTAETSGPDDEDVGAEDGGYARGPELGEKGVTAVALDLGGGEVGGVEGRGDGGRGGH